MISLATLRRFGPWLLGLFLTDQVAGILPLAAYASWTRRSRMGRAAKVRGRRWRGDARVGVDGATAARGRGAGADRRRGA